MIISTIQNKEDTQLILQKARKLNKKVIVTALDPSEALEYYENGADYVLIPHMVGGDHLSMILENNHHRSFHKLRNEHIGRLHKHARH